MQAQGMKQVNKMECAEGRFTRFPRQGSEGQKSILDLFPVDEGLEQQVKSLMVDEKKYLQVRFTSQVGNHDPKSSRDAANA